MKIHFFSKLFTYFSEVFELIFTLPGSSLVRSYQTKQQFNTFLAMATFACYDCLLIKLHNFCSNSEATTHIKSETSKLSKSIVNTQVWILFADQTRVRVHIVEIFTRSRLLWVSKVDTHNPYCGDYIWCFALNFDPLSSHPNFCRTEQIGVNFHFSHHTSSTYNLSTFPLVVTIRFPNWVE